MGSFSQKRNLHHAQEGIGGGFQVKQGKARIELCQQFITA